MNTTERLAFRLTIAEPNTDERTITVCPRYDNLKLKWSRPSGQMYYTEDISGTLKFLGVDFQTINACALKTQFTLIVYQNRVEVGRSLFRKTDCKWDIDHGVVDVDISVYDEYKKFQDKKDEEYNLVKLLNLKHDLNLYVFPQNQVYVLNDNVITLYASTQDYGVSYGVAESSNIIDLNVDGFYPNALRAGSNQLDGRPTICPIVYCTDFEYADPDIEPIFSGDAFFNNTNTWDVNSIASYMVYTKKLYKGGNVTGNDYILFEYGEGIPGQGAYRLRYFKLYLVVNDVKRYATSADGTFVVSEQTPLSFSTLVKKTSMMFYKYYPSDGHIASDVGVPASTRFCVPIIRELTSLAIEGSELDKEDIASEYINNYKSYIKKENIIPVISLVACNNTSNEDTGYGKVENEDYYYAKPDESNFWIPIYKDAWFKGFSFWLGNNNVPDEDKESYKSQEKVSDFYLLTDAIRTVAQKIDEDIQFDSLDSEFLFNSLNPLNGIQQGALYISQKSNILNLGYDYPAWLAPVKWSQIETLLREAFDCYWSLYVRDGHKHLRIEHRRWYELGGTYTQSSVQVASIDLTATFRNGTSFTFGEKTRHWEFDTDGNGTVSTASRHEYGWMDTQSEIFDGQPITVPEAYRLFTDEKTEQHKVDWFSSDIDFLTSVQAECSSDGFALVMENPNQPNWIITGATEYSGQNYQLSFDYLQKKYLLQGIYAEYIKIGDNATLTATNSNARMRTSEIQLRVPAGMSIEASDTIKTQVGIGVIDTLEYDLHSGLYTATLRYENE